MYLVFVLGIVIVWHFIKRSRELFTIPPEKSFDGYARSHPHCVINGRVQCAHCGGKQIWLRLHAADQSKQINSHVCKSCGQELYRSMTLL